MDKRKSKQTLGIEHSLMQIGEILQLIQNRHGSITVSPELVKQLEGLKEASALLKEVTEQTFGTTDFAIDAPTLADLPKSQQQLLQRAKNIEQDARKLKVAYSKALERSKASTPHLTKEATDRNQKRRERRKLFKPLGGDKSWIPL